MADEYTNPEQPCDHVFVIDGKPEPVCDRGVHKDEDILRKWREQQNPHYMEGEKRESQRRKWKDIVARACYGIIKSDPKYHKPNLIAKDIIEPVREDFLLHLESRMFPHLEPPAWLTADEQLVTIAIEAEAAWILFCQKDRNELLIRYDNGLDGALDHLPEAPPPRKRGTLLVSVKPEITEWLWPNHFELGAISDIQGDPGTGKSAITANIAAIVTRGGSWPTGEKCEPGGVLVINGEEDLKKGIVPHLIAAGANLARMKAYTLLDEPLFELPRDLDLLEADVVELKARAVIVDPLDCFVSEDVEINRNQNIRRQVLAALARLASIYKFAVILVRHLNKDAKTKVAMYRGSGSIGLNAASRGVWMVGHSPTDPDVNVMAMVKVNNAPPQKSLAYRLEPMVIKGEHDEDIKTVRASWIGEVDLEAHQLLQDPPKSDKPRGAKSKLGDCMAALRAILADGFAHDSTEVEEQLKEQGYSHGSVWDAKKELKVKSQQKGFHGGWAWSLPQSTEDDTAYNEKSRF